MGAGPSPAAGGASRFDRRGARAPLTRRLGRGPGPPAQQLLGAGRRPACGSLGEARSGPQGPQRAAARAGVVSRAGAGAGQSGAAATPDPEDTKRYEQRLSRLLVAFLSSGLAFLLAPGGLLGVWSLLSISRAQSPTAVPPALLQAHGHAQVYGWVGSFILGIGFHSLARLRGVRVRLGLAWACWAMWTAGVALGWWGGVSGWHWRLLLPASAVLEVAAFLLFQTTAFGAHRRHAASESGTGGVGAPGLAAIAGSAPAAGGGRRSGAPGWVLLVLTGAAGCLLTLLMNLAAYICHAGWTATRVFSPGYDTRLVTLMGWAFLVPFIWGFSTRWLPIFAGFRAAPDWLARWLIALVAVGTLATLAGWFLPAALCWLTAAVLAAAGLGVLRPAVQKAKTQGIHRGFPIFLRLAYGWLLAAAALGVWAALRPGVAGLLGAARHALTVGFVAAMVVAIGCRVLPAFSGMKRLFSPALMGWSLALVNLGCLARVTCEVLAYPGWLAPAWMVLPFSAAIEGVGLALFAYNLARTLASPPAHLQPAAA